MVEDENAIGRVRVVVRLIASPSAASLDQAAAAAAAAAAVAATFGTAAVAG